MTKAETKRLQDMLDHLGMRYSPFAESIGIPKTTMGSYISGKRSPTIVFFQKVKKHYPQINLNWLITGKGEMLGDDNPQLEEIKQKYLTALEENNRLLKNSIVK